MYVSNLHLTFGLYFRKFTLLSGLNLLQESGWDAGEISRSTLLPQSAGAALGFSRTQVPFRL